MNRMAQVLQLLGVLRPDLRQAANLKAVTECAPKLVELFKDAKTDEQKNAANNEFQAMVKKRTDEILMGMIAEGTHR